MDHFKQTYSDYTIKWATLDWEIEQSFALRKRVFCAEQGIFADDDRDGIDQHAQVLVAIANHGGWHEKVVGTVRIHQDKEMHWWGSRLAVDRDFRSTLGLGAVLIKLAVSSANGMGCKQFLAQVQKRNEPLFKRLKWQSKFDISVMNQPHVMMEADLDKFPPCYQPKSGFVIQSKVIVDQQAVLQQELAPELLYPYCSTGNLQSRSAHYQRDIKTYDGVSHGT